MIHPFTNAQHSRIDGQPFEYRQDMSLFDFALAQGAAVKAAEVRLAAAREAHARAERVLHETMEFRDLEAAKERAREAKKAAVDRDEEVAAERENVKAARAALKATARDVVRAEKKARGDVKALVEVCAETRAGIAEAIVSGKVPSPIVKEGK